MAEVKLSENGQLINSQTGQVIGSFKGGNGVNFNSNSAESKTLQELGVSLPPLEEEQDEDNEDNNININNTSNTPLFNSSISNIIHTQKGKSSFKYKDSKYQVNKDSYFIITFGLLQQDDGRFVPINIQATDKFPTSEKHWVKFRMWNYFEQLQWKQSVMEYNNVAKIQILNNDKLNEIKLKKLMLDWSFGEYDDNLKLLHCDNKLSDESYSMFMGMYPAIAKTIVDLMNLVLESNQ